MSVTAVRARAGGPERRLETVTGVLAAVRAALRQEEVWPFTPAPRLGWRARCLRLLPLAGVPVVAALVVSALLSNPGSAGHALAAARRAQPAPSPTQDYPALQVYALTDPHLTGQLPQAAAVSQETDDAPGQPPGRVPAIGAPGQAFSAAGAILPGLSGAGSGATLGSFSYTANADGSINQDPAWVQANIVTQAVPILGPETCNRLLFPQLAGALAQLQSEGLGGLISTAPPDDRPGQCYQPRFVNSNPALGVSLHAWGIAIDINAVENPEGQPSHQDPRLVAVFEQWGFRWGGTWATPDPMHFELATIHLPGATDHTPVAAAAGTALDVALAPSPPVTTGSLLGATATVSGPIGATATVTFRLYGPQPADCSGQPISSSTALVHNGVATAQPVTAGPPGIYHWTAALVAGSGASTSTECATAPVEVTDPPLVLRTQVAQPTVGFGVPESLQVDISGGATPDGGTLGFALYGPDDPTCGSTPQIVSSDSLNGDGIVTSAQVTPAAPGTYQWVVSFSGDAQNPPTSTPCGAAPLTVTP